MIYQINFYILIESGIMLLKLFASEIYFIEDMMDGIPLNHWSSVKF